MDRFDTILADIAKPVNGKKWVFEFDLLEESFGKEKGVCILFFLIRTVYKIGYWFINVFKITPFIMISTENYGKNK